MTPDKAIAQLWDMEIAARLVHESICETAHVNPKNWVTRYSLIAETLRAATEHYERLTPSCSSMHERKNHEVDI